MRRRLFWATVILGMTAAALWAGAIAATWWNFDRGRGITVLAAGAGAATVLAWQSWRERVNRDRAMLYLIDRACASPRPARDAADVPLRAVRAQ